MTPEIDIPSVKAEVEAAFAAYEEALVGNDVAGLDRFFLDRPSTIRYGAATVLFWAFTYAREGSFRIALRDMRLVVLAALFIFSNQILFVYAIDKTSASTVTLFLGATPIFIGVLASVVGLERMGRGFWIATAVSLVGVGFVASGSGGFSGHLFGDTLALSTAATWAGYSRGSTTAHRPTSCRPRGSSARSGTSTTSSISTGSRRPKSSSCASAPRGSSSG